MRTRLMLYQYRVTKYDPSHRSASGAYLGEDWISRSDIGSQFGGVVLTQQRYLEVEQAYLDAAKAFLVEADIRCLRVCGLENHRRNAAAPKAGSDVSTEAVSSVLRGLLREDFWCKLETSTAFVHVGWDYYMYIGVPRRCAGAEQFTRSLGLFAEVFSSPYLRNEDAGYSAVHEE
jgi:hypothetical protein